MRVGAAVVAEQWYGNAPKGAGARRSSTVICQLCSRSPGKDNVRALKH